MQPYPGVLEARGRNGTVRFDGALVTLARETLMARSTAGSAEHRIPVGQVAGVQWRPASWATNGFIRFETSAAGAMRAGRAALSLEATRDPFAVIFRPKQQAAFEALRDAVQTAITAGQQPRSAPANGLGAELERLAEMARQGMLTPQEFAAAKARLLNGQ